MCVRVLPHPQIPEYKKKKKKKKKQKVFSKIHVLGPQSVSQGLIENI
jgi:hypothetical protein